MNLFTKQKQTHRHRRQYYQRGKWKEFEGGINQEFGINRYTTVYTIDNQQGPTSIAQGTMLNIL